MANNLIHPDEVIAWIVKLARDTAQEALPVGASDEEVDRLAAQIAYYGVSPLYESTLPEPESQSSTHPDLAQSQTSKPGADPDTPE